MTWLLFTFYVPSVKLSYRSLGPAIPAATTSPTPSSGRSGRLCPRSGVAGSSIPVRGSVRCQGPVVRPMRAPPLIASRLALPIFMSIRYSSSILSLGLARWSPIMGCVWGPGASYRRAPRFLYRTVPASYLVAGGRTDGLDLDVTSGGPRIGRWWRHLVHNLRTEPGVQTSPPPPTHRTGRAGWTDCHHFESSVRSADSERSHRPRHRQTPSQIYRVVLMDGRPPHQTQRTVRMDGRTTNDGVLAVIVTPFDFGVFAADSTCNPAYGLDGSDRLMDARHLELSQRSGWMYGRHLERS
ncbi:hypothetical protein MPTK1_6g04690 [Marchantia polymorpha subsp. ruderalis]|uniref:Uncharacterized protein n=1 Tax=Marchantia polymorpha subsp. ruderalis TaxID=1480154 RepID=A0AAF6BNI5_MARPO|nr:hypothetical protein Mp_6g04690 [Marchantia polymorpha subsp. ruderalis]